MKEYISIDIGGTAIKYGVVREDGTILCRSEMATEAYKGGPAILEKALGIVEKLAGTYRIGGICISTAGMVDTRKGGNLLFVAANPSLCRDEVQGDEEERFGFPCEVENDVNCAGLAEYMSGASKGSRAAVMLTVGTGIRQDVL